LLRVALAGVKAAGAEADMVRLGGLSYGGCTACMQCGETARCTQIDQASPVYEKLFAADIWLFASPVYFDGVCGQMKLFWDRLVCLTFEGNQLTGRRAGGFILSYERQRSDYYLVVGKKLVDYFPWFGEFVASKVLTAPELGEPDEASKAPELLQKARLLGYGLTEALAGQR
jgi:multimeric flavodoxin WrbA